MFQNWNQICVSLKKWKSIINPEVKPAFSLATIREWKLEIFKVQIHLSEPVTSEYKLFPLRSSWYFSDLNDEIIVNYNYGNPKDSNPLWFNVIHHLSKILLPHFISLDNFLVK